jgi:hypothetical protein
LEQAMHKAAALATVSSHCQGYPCFGDPPMATLAILTTYENNM